MKAKLGQFVQDCRIDGDETAGHYLIPVNGVTLQVGAVKDGGWEHATVKPKELKRCPTWDEMKAVKAMFWKPEECVIQYHPPASAYVNRDEFMLHLWRPYWTDVPMPPLSFVLGF